MNFPYHKKSVIRISSSNTCLMYRIENMDEFINSDSNDSKMIATQTFNNILDGIQRSNLNFQLQVSPFSAFIKLKKTLVKDKCGSFLQPRQPPPLPATDASSLPFFHSDIAKLVARVHELENVLETWKSRNEVAENDREDGYQKLKATELKMIDNLRKLENEHKALKQESKSLVTKLENKSLEVKQLKGKIEELNKDKNTLNVALKSAKQELKSQNKTFEKQLLASEKKVAELNNFKIKKLNDERQEKLQKRKELKMKARKMRNNENNNEKNDVNVEEKILEDGSSYDSDEEKMPKPELACSQDVCAQHAIELNPVSDETVDDKSKDIDLEEKEEGFIGPRLPRMMTDKEFKSLMDKVFGDKYG